MIRKSTPQLFNECINAVEMCTEETKKIHEKLMKMNEEAKRMVNMLHQLANNKKKPSKIRQPRPTKATSDPPKQQQRVAKTQGEKTYSRTNTKNSED